MGFFSSLFGGGSNDNNGVNSQQIQTVYQKCMYCKYVERQADGTFMCALGYGFIGNNASEVFNDYRYATDLPCYGSKFEPWKDIGGKDYIDEPNYSKVQD